ncbi:MAG: leucine-rich repeat protein, partial [Bacteroidaceae bacterium]|nr:leucine-rich repeat protein [Bacteroidaceae bacterium]
MKTIKLIICISLLWMIGIGVHAEEIPNNEIWYTSSDGKVVTPNKSDAFGASIISKTYSNGKGVIVFDNSVTSIGDYAFSGYSGLTSITIPNSVTSIGYCAFYHCSGLTSITIPNSVTSIGSCAFEGCSGLTSITIPNSVTSIGSHAFSGCSGLTSITIPNSVTSIGDKAFYRCSGLTSITIPNSVTSIGDYAFDGCSGLTSINIPNSVTSIGYCAFYYCSGLTSITIPNSVTSIGSGAFSYCSGLTSIYVYWNQPLSINSSVYSRVDLSKVTLHVPSGTKSKYQSADVWKEFGTIKEFDIPITSISLDKTSASIHPDESITLFATISPENATNTTISWKSSDTNIATVSNGIVTGINVGKATITATTTDDTDLSTSCEIIVTPIPILTKSISLNKSTAEMLVDDNLTLSATITPSNATNKDVEWSSSDNSIATVDNGIVKAIKVGTVTITAKTTDGSNLSATCNIKVVPISIYVSSVSLSKTSIDLLVEENATITATVYPDNASNPTLAWSSSDENVATVDGGKVTATGEGTATITARTVDGSDLSATCTVNVSRHSQSITWNQDLSNLTYGSELITLQATSSSGLPVSYKSSDDNVAIIFDMGNAIYLNPGIAGTAIITARQEGNNYYAPAEMTK